MCCWDCRPQPLLLDDHLMPSWCLCNVQVITHQMPLSKAAEGYKIFNEKQDGCVKVVLRPELQVEE